MVGGSRKDVGPSPASAKRLRRTSSSSVGTAVKKRHYSTIQIFVAFTCVFVIFLTAKYTTVSWMISPTTSHKMAWMMPKQVSEVGGKVTQAQVSTAIETERALVATEMANFPFKDDQQLEDLVMEKGGQPTRALITTTWRSGSTFLGDILLSHPATYYHYEPLIHYGIRQVREGGDLARNSVHVLKSLFHCDYSTLGANLNFAKSHKEVFSHNVRLWQYCHPKNVWMCQDPGFLNQMCAVFPFQSMKTVRLRLNLTMEILDDKSLNVKVLFLVRDPRGTMQSRKHRVWCPDNPDCDQSERLCSDLVADYYAAKRLLKEYPDRLKVYRYEDFCQDIEHNSIEMLTFFGLSMQDEVRAFLKTHTTTNRGGVSSTFRNTKNAPFKWKNEMPFAEVDKIQRHCGLAMKLWGYRQARSKKQLEQLQPVRKLNLA